MDEFAYHITDLKNIKNIKIEGLKPNPLMNRLYFANSIEDTIAGFSEKTENKNFIQLRILKNHLKLLYNIERINELREFFVEHSISSELIEIFNSKENKWVHLMTFKE